MCVKRTEAAGGVEQTGRSTEVNVRLGLPGGVGGAEQEKPLWPWICPKSKGTSLKGFKPEGI